MAASQGTSALAFLGRLTWMMIGPLALALMTFLIIAKGGGWFTGADAAYFVVLGAMLLGRWLDFHGGDPRKATGEPASAADLRRYLLVTAPIGLIIWAIANLLGNHWLPP